MATIALSDGFIPSSKDTPLDKRTRVNLYEEIQNIKNPYVGMEILVLADETNSGRKTRYRVESLKANDLGMENALIDMTTIKKVESYEVNLEELIHITKAKIDEFLLNPVLGAEGVAYERQLYQIDNLIPFDIEDEYIARIGTEEIVIKAEEVNNLEFIGYNKRIKLHLNLDNTGEYNENYACLEFEGITVDNSNDLCIYKSDTIYINEDAIPKCYPKEIKVREIIDRALENINSIEYVELETTDDTIIGAINELKRALANITTDDSGEAVNLPFNSIDKGLASSNIDFSEIKNGTYCYIIRGSIGYDVPEGNLPLNNDMVHITKSNIAMTVITLNGDIYTYNGGTNGTNYISCTKDNFMTYSVASETYQLKNDSKLITNNKTVVGAINELKNALDSVDGAFTILTVSPTYEELDTLPEGSKVYILNGLGIDGDPVHIYKSGNNITITTIDGTINKYIKFGTTWTSYSTEERATKSYVDTAIANAQLGDLAEYQKITDNSLVTIDKTIVGAINEIGEQLEDIEKKVNDHIESCSGGETSIDDTTISTDRTWSSAKIEDFVHTNDDVVWSTVQGENLSVDYSKEGYLREVEIWGNTIQNEEDLSNIQHLGELYADEEGQPILDGEGREQYKIEIESSNFYTSDLFYLGNNVSELDLEPNFINTNNVRNSKFTIELECGDFKDGKIIYFKNGYSLELSKEGTALKLRNFNTDAGETSKMFNCNKGDIISIVYNGIVNLYVNGNFIASLGWLQYYGNICVVQNLSFLKINTISVAQEHLLKSEPKTYKTTLLLPCQLMKVGDVADRLYWDSSKGRYVVAKNIAVPKVFKNLPLTTHTYEINGNKYYSVSFTSPVSFINNTRNILSTKLKCNNSIWGNIDSEGIRAINNAIMIRVLFDKVTDITTFINDMDIYIEISNPQLIETNIIEQILLPCYKDKTHLFVTGGIDGTIKAKIPLDGGQAIQSLSVMNLALNEEVSTLTLENEELKSTNDTQDELINTTMLATDEMYMMIEPLLLEAVQTLSLERSVSKMVDMYVAMVQRGLKTIEQVPVRYREQVKEILAQLEK